MPYLLQATPAALPENDYGTTLIVLCTCLAIGFVLKRFVYLRLNKKLDVLATNPVTETYSDAVQNELDYADYLAWAATNGYTPMKKTTGHINTNAL